MSDSQNIRADDAPDTVREPNPGNQGKVTNPKVPSTAQGAAHAPGFAETNADFRPPDPGPPPPRGRAAADAAGSSAAVALCDRPNTRGGGRHAGYGPVTGSVTRLATTATFGNGLDQDEIDDLLAHVLREPTVRDAARRLLDPGLFDQAGGEAAYNELARAVRELGERHPGDIPYRVLRKRLDACNSDSFDEDARRLLLDEPGDCDPANWRDVPGLLYRTYKLTDPADLDAAHGLHLLERLVIEREVERGLDRLVASKADTEKATGLQRSIMNLGEMLGCVQDRIGEIRKITAPVAGRNRSTRSWTSFSQPWRPVGAGR